MKSLSTETIFQYYLKRITETSQIGIRGFAFYLAINFALLGYLFTAKISDDMKVYLASIGILTSVLMGISTIVMGIWVIKSSKFLEKFIQQQNKETYFNLDMEKIYKGANLMVGILFSCFSIVIVALMLLYFIHL